MCNKFAPEISIPTKYSSTEWLQNAIKNAITKRDRLFQKWISEPSAENKSSYKKQRNIMMRLLRSAKRDCNLSKLGENPTQKTNQVIRNKET